MNGSTVSTSIEIWNGPHVTQPIGYLRDLEERLIPIWSKEPSDLFLAMIDAIGPLPLMPTTGAGGEMQVSGWAQAGDAQVPQYTYSPAGDVVNQSITAMYQAQVSAWNARAAAIAQCVQAMLAKG